jgi:hypothetical protein
MLVFAALRLCERFIFSQRLKVESWRKVFAALRLCERIVFGQRNKEKRCSSFE